jgi:hypothetical protein
MLSFPWEFSCHLIPGSMAGAVSAGLLTEAESEDVFGAMERAERDGGLFAALPIFIVSGTKA